MQTEIKLRKIINESHCSNPADLLIKLGTVLDAMAHGLPEDGRIHELFIKKLDGNTVDSCDCPKSNSRYESMTAPTNHVSGCRKGQPNIERRFLVVLSVSTGDSGEDDADA